MGKLHYSYTDSDTDIISLSSIENTKKKKATSILKTNKGPMKKKKCKFHRKVAKTESEDSFTNKPSSTKIRSTLRGILKHKEYSTSPESDVDDYEVPKCMKRCLVGRVPRPAGARPGRGGGVALVVKRAVDPRTLQGRKSFQPQSSVTNLKKMQALMKKLSKKQSF